MLVKMTFQNGWQVITIFQDCTSFGKSSYCRGTLDCLELDDGDDRIESLYVRIRGKVNKADMVEVCYRPPNEDEEVNKIYKQLGEVLQRLALVLVVYFNLSDVCCGEEVV